jgi:transposase
MGPARVVDDATDGVAYWRERSERAEGQLAELNVRVAELSEQVAVLSRMLFGRSSERTRPAPDGADDVERPDGDSADSAREPGDPGRSPRGQRRGGRGHGRRDYSHLETREEVHDVPVGQRVCACCGIAFEPLGAQSSEQIDWRVRVTRIVHRRLRYRRRCDCPGARTVTAPPAANPIPKGRFTSEFLARLLYEKYVMGLPVHRIVRSLAAEGLRVPEGTLCGVLKGVADLLLPLEQAIVERNAQAVHVHADETSWRVFEQTEGKQGHRWWLWVFLAPDTVVFTMDQPARPLSWTGTSGSTVPRRRWGRVGGWCSRRTSTPPISPWPGSRESIRCGAGRSMRNRGLCGTFLWGRDVSLVGCCSG